MAPIRMRGDLDLRAARRLADRVRAEKADLMHYHTAHAVGIGTLASFFCGRVPAVATRRVSFPLRGGWIGRFKKRKADEPVVRPFELEEPDLHAHLDELVDSVFAD